MVIIVDLAVAVNDGQGFEGAGVVDVFPGRAVFELFRQERITVPLEERSYAIDRLDVAAAQGVVGHGDARVVRFAGGDQAVLFVPGEPGEVVVVLALGQIAGGIEPVFGLVVAGGAQAVAGVGQVFEQVAGRVVAEAVDLVFGVQGFGDAAHGVVAELPGAFLVVVSGGQVAGRIVAIASLNGAGGAGDGLAAEPAGFVVSVFASQVVGKLLAGDPAQLIALDGDRRLVVDPDSGHGAQGVIAVLDGVAMAGGAGGAPAVGIVLVLDDEVAGFFSHQAVGGIEEALCQGTGGLHAGQVAVGVPVKIFLLFAFKGLGQQSAGIVVGIGDGALQWIAALDQLTGRIVAVTGGVAVIVGLGDDPAGVVVLE